MSADNDRKSNLYAAAMNGGIPALEPTSAGTATAASVTVKREPGMLSVASLLEGLDSISADEVEVVKKPNRKAAAVEKLIAATRAADERKAAADAKKTLRMPSMPGQPGHHIGQVSIVSSKRMIFHQVDADVLEKMGNPAPFVLHRVKGMTPKGELTGVFTFDKFRAASVSPYVDFGSKCRVVGHIEVSHPKCKPALGQTGFNGNMTAYASWLEQGANAKELYLSQKLFLIPVMAPVAKSNSGLSASLGVTFGFDEMIDAMLMPANKDDAMKKRDNLKRILKNGFAVGEQLVTGDDSKETKMITTSIVGAMEILAQYDMKTSFCFWYKASGAPKGQPEFYDSENMVGGVFGQIYSFVQQIVLQYESGLAPAVIKPQDDLLKIQAEATHRQMMSLADENLKLKTEMAALKADAANNNQKESDAKFNLLASHTKGFIDRLNHWDVVDRNVAAVQNGDYKTAKEVKDALALARGVKSASNLAGRSNLPSLVAKKPAVAAAAATAAAATATAAAAPAAAAMENSDDES